MGRRRRRVIKVIKKRLPTIFTCPSCGQESVKVLLVKESGTATVCCGACGLKQDFEVSPSSQIVDIYCMFTDKFYSSRKMMAEPHSP